MSIFEILEAHTLAYDWYPCSCGVKWVWDGRSSGTEQHRDHVAQALEQHEQEAKAETLEEAADEIERLDGGEAEMYNEELNATPVTFWLRDRAAQIRGAS